MNGKQQEERRVNSQDRRSDNRWQLDRHIPVAVIVMLLFQTGAGIWYARGLDATVMQAVRDNDKQDRRIEVLEAARLAGATTEARLVSIENEVRMMRMAVEGLDAHRRQQEKQK